MNTTPFFLAQRILWNNVYKKSISIMTAVCFISIFIASFALSLITAIMNGFECAIYEKMQGIHSHLIIQSYDNDIDLHAIQPILQKEFPEIKSFAPVATQHVLLRVPGLVEEVPIVVMIKGINPEMEHMTTALAQKIIKKLPETENFSQLFSDSHIVIGKQLAHNNQIKIGDKLELLFIREGQIHGKKITLDSGHGIVSGIFDTGIDEFDSGVIYTSLSFLERLYPNLMIEQINVALTSVAHENFIIKKLRNRFGLDVYSWKDLYPSLVASLKLEKYVSFFVLALILLVASTNIISLLFMYITQKRSMIALLKAIGMTNYSINILFFSIGIFISFIACISGLSAACGASFILQKYPFITLPDSYYVTYLPVAMDVHIIGIVFSLVMILSIAAMIIPIRYIRSIDVSQVLRFEG